ncbi:MAG: PA2169 family four-helix-bundle protein [Daejeonella sp.]
MESKEQTGVLNDLILINNDRIEGYQRAKEELKDGNEDLKSLFTDMIAESHTLKMQLATEVAASGEDIEQGTTNSGKIYRVWMDVKAAFTGHDRKAVLANCEFGEDAAQKAYDMAIKEDGLPGHILSLISQQKTTLRASHDKIKALRDAQV